MTPVHLHEPTAIAPLDAALSTVIAVLERHLAPRVLSYYLVGSYAVGEAIAASDVDLLVVFRDELSDVDRRQLAALRDSAQATTYAIDLTADSLPKLLRLGGVWFQTASRCLYGVDIRSQVPRKPVPLHQRDLMHSVYPLLARVRGNPPRLRVPLAFPDAAGRLYGYDQRTLGTKDLVTNTLAIANARTLQAAGHYAGSGTKADIPRQYQRWINDQWTWLVREVYDTCRNRWGYAIPELPAEQEHLRRICRNTLAFENDFLAAYAGFLVQELQHPDAGVVRHAVQRLGHLIYGDREIARRLARLQQHPDAGVVSAVSEALAWYGSPE